MLIRRKLHPCMQNNYGLVVAWHCSSYCVINCLYFLLFILIGCRSKSWRGSWWSSLHHHFTRNYRKCNSKLISFISGSPAEFTVEDNMSGRNVTETHSQAGTVLTATVTIENSWFLHVKPSKMSQEHKLYYPIGILAIQTISSRILLTMSW